MKPSSKCVKWA
ncbi:Threonine dehydratase [Escherichia coli P12b]|nr:Threonine dehydratase [Escherichia coli P12b]